MRHTIQSGECISSVATRYGFYWGTLWDHPENAELRRLRGNPNVLYKGDVVFIPERHGKDASCATGLRHRFRLKGVPARLALRVVDAGQPRADEPFVAVIDGVEITGTTGPDGDLLIWLPPGAAQGKLTVGQGTDARVFDLKLRRLDPLTTVSGVHQRLRNLGYDAPEDGELGPRMRAALLAFQRAQGLDRTGEIDDATRRKLEQAHGT